MSLPDFKKLTETEKDYIISFRRELHEYPEIAGEEIRTSQRISEELEKLAIPYIIDEKRNVIAKLNTGKPGKKLALRADFDALPMQEETGLPYASKIDGRAHLCGHDAHAAALLGAAKILSSMKNELAGTIYFCFQMGEETCEGAPEIIEYLEKEGGVDMVASIHLMPGFPPGCFLCPVGPMMAGTLQWELKVHGKGGHGSTPWIAVDPIKPMCDIILRITSLAANRVNPADQFVVSPCVINSGTANNVIPELARSEGTIRFYKPELAKQLPALIENISKNVAASYGAEAEFNILRSCMPVVNDAACVELAKKASAKLGFAVYPMQPVTGSDNYGEFLNKYKGFYMFNGVTPQGKDIILNHNPKYEIDENAMLINTVFFTSFAYDYLNGLLDS